MLQQDTSPVSQYNQDTTTDAMTTGGGMTTSHDPMDGADRRAQVITQGDPLYVPTSSLPPTPDTTEEK